MGIHRLLREYINKNGRQNLYRYIAHLSHKIYLSQGLKGHLIRQRIRGNLKNYAYRQLGR